MLNQNFLYFFIEDMITLQNILYVFGLLLLFIYIIQIIAMTFFHINMKFYVFSENAYIGNISQFIILIILWYHIIPVMKSQINILLKIIFIVILFIMPFILFYPMLSIYNLICLFYFTNPPFIDNINKIFPENMELESNYKIYKEELDKIYNENADVDCIANNNPGFRIGEVKEKCWRAIYIKVLNEYKIEDFDKKYPKLYKILNKPYISNAFLSILDGNVDIPEHYGYFKGYYRYHLGYVIPQYQDKKAYIVCGGEKYIWKEGKGVLFDDMYNHYVRNDTPYQRIVLYLDILRPEMRNDFTNILLYLMSKNYFVQQIDKSQHKQKKIH